MDNQESIIKSLKGIPWFLELSPAQLDALAQIAIIRMLKDGEIMFTEGDSDNGLFVILEGEVEINTHVPGHGSVQIYTAEPLDIVGWSVLTPIVRQRTATARALGNIRFISFNSQILRQMCEQDRDLGYIIMRRIANVVASRLLITRLQLYDLLSQMEIHSNLDQL
jgi:CRP/FNR family transcriptional regulator, cyclic AMP receptor protein